MIRFLKLSVVLLTAFFISGCIEIQTLVKVNKDGSGTLEETVLMSNEMVNMMNEFMSGFASDTAKPEEFKLYKEEDLKNKETKLGENVKFLSGEEIKTDSKQGYKVLYGFTDLNKLKIDQSPASRIPEDSANIDMDEKKFITFGFSKGDISELRINMPPSEKNEEEVKTEESSDSTQQGDLSEAKFLLKDLSFSFKVQVDGVISETNAEYKDDNEVTLVNLNFGELLNNTEKLQMLEKSDYDYKELKDIMKDIPGIKIEINDPVFIKFR